MATFGRRRSDKLAYAVLRSLLALSIALSLLASYLAYKAINTMNAVSRLAVDAYHLGIEIGKQPDYVPRTEHDEQ